MPKVLSSANLNGAKKKVVRKMTPKKKIMKMKKKALPSSKPPMKAGAGRRKRILPKEGGDMQPHTNTALV